ncbi:MAG: glycosyltransferase [Magnetococcales bacterium]|nr:glycosyltransferase [Magnetococcales bacterium]
MIALLHGYLLEGSGSNLWTRAIVQGLCRAGETVHLMCQEQHPEAYDFISKAIHYHPDGREEMVLDRTTSYPGEVIFHRPELGSTLPVYVWDRYDWFEKVTPMVELDDAAIEAYLQRNVEVLERIIQRHPITVLHANHTVMMPEVARRAAKAHGLPYAAMPHGSALEYAVKRDRRFHKMGQMGLEEATLVVVTGDEVRQRLNAIYPTLSGLNEKVIQPPLGVDMERFKLVDRTQRRAEIEQLQQRLARLSPGANVPMDARLETLPKQPDRKKFTTCIQEVSHLFDLKKPDEGLARNLERIAGNDGPVLLYVGRLISAKGVHSILMALPELLRQWPDLKWLVVGHGPLRGILEALLWALRCGKREWLRALVRWGSLLEEPAQPLDSAQGHLDYLAEGGQLERWFADAERLLKPDTVLFTGYLTHAELQHLFPCCDAAVFPSVVAESGPMVFLEALASGVWPLGTDHAGMAASIGAFSALHPELDVSAMKVRPEAAMTVRDIVAHLPMGVEQLQNSPNLKEIFYNHVRNHHDWRAIADYLNRRLSGS